MESALKKLREGRLSFDGFARETHGDWERLSAKLLRRWKAPPAVDSEDLVQELLLAAWQSVGKWNEGQGMKLKPFVVWHAMTAAKRWLNVQRGVSSHNGDKSPSRYDIAVDWDLADSGGPNCSKLMPTVEASQERIVQWLQRLRMATRMLYTEQARARPHDIVELGGLEDVLELLIACGETPWSRVGKFMAQTAIQLEE
jgi:DNA-directed RNA polymerase specialized sigma24 family protein